MRRHCFGVTNDDDLPLRHWRISKIFESIQQLTTGKDHIIQKAILRIKLPDEQQAYDWQSQFIAAFNAQGLPALEAILDRFSEGDKIIHIDQLQLDLGAINLQKLSTELPAKLSETIAAALYKALGDHGESTAVKRMAATESIWYQWIAFLRTGQVSWAENVTGFAPDDLLRKLLEEQPVRLRQALPALVRDTKVLERLCLQFSPTLLLELLGLLQPTMPDYYTVLLKSIKTLGTRVAALPRSSTRQSAFALALLLTLATQDRSQELPPAKAATAKFYPAILQFAETYLPPEKRAALQEAQRQFSKALAAKEQSGEATTTQEKAGKTASRKAASKKAPADPAQMEADWLEWAEFVTQQSSAALPMAAAQALSNLVARLLEHQATKLFFAMPAWLAQPAVLQKITQQLPPPLLHRLLALVHAGLEHEAAGYLAHLKAFNRWEPVFPKGAQAQAAFVYAMLLDASIQPGLEIASAAAGMEHCLPMMLDFAAHYLPQNNQGTPRQRLINALTNHNLGQLMRLLGQMELAERPQLKSQLAIAAQHATTDPEWREFLQVAIQEALRQTFTSDEREPLAHRLWHVLQLHLKRAPKQLNTIWQEVFEQNLATGKAVLETENNPQKSITIRNASIDLPTPEPSEDGYYVDNAGIVLLNPFFEPCFAELGFTKHGKFIDDEAREDALMLLAYMGSGEKEIVEARLPLLKLLLGMDIMDPVRARADLPDHAYTEADAVLTAASEHWEKAGKLTPEQFRQAFLMREGKVKELEGGWNLKVDRQTIDILLEFLPWGFSTIYLPWMGRILTVDW